MHSPTVSGISAHGRVTRHSAKVFSSSFRQPSRPSQDVVVACPKRAVNSHARHGRFVTTEYRLRSRCNHSGVGAMSEEDNGNPNLGDRPDETVGGANRGVRQDDDNQQVMSAQSANTSAPTTLPTMLNGTYGSVGPMTMDDEVRQPAVDPGVQSEATSSGIGRAGNGPSASSLRAAAGKVMATMAAKVQEVMPPSGRSGSAASFLAQEDTGSAGTVGSGYVTAGSEPQREARVVEERDQSQQGLFSPQQARRLQQMESEAPLLYHGEDGSVRPTSLLPQLPHSTSSGSDQAEAIQAEVKRQMQSYLIVQAELQQRVAVLVEENQVLRQVAASNEAGSEVQGSQAGKGGWFSGIRRNILGLVQQVPMKAAGMPLAIPEGWAVCHPLLQTQPRMV